MIRIIRVLVRIQIAGPHSRVDVLGGVRLRPENLHFQQVSGDAGGLGTMLCFLK